MRVALITPPPIKPSEPGISAAAAATMLRALGVDASCIDASIGWHMHALAPERLRSLAGTRPDGASRRAVRASEEGFDALRRPHTYASRERYSSAVAHLENALQLAARPHPELRLGIADIRGAGPTDRPESSDWLVRMAHTEGPFDDYFEQELLVDLERRGVTHVAVSLSFQQQAPAAFRLAVLLRQRLPGVRRWLGGPLVACWRAAGFGLDGPPFDSFERLFSGDDEDLRAIATMAGSGAGAIDAVVRTTPFDDVPWPSYLSPTPTVPVALGRGCYWRKCSFCPDHLHARHRPCGIGALAAWLHEVARRFPSGAMLHLTDSAVPPGHMLEIATVIRRDRLPIRWHGFCRLEPELADPDFVARLAEGGCAMLQLGVESASPRLLSLLGKGTDVDGARRVLAATSAVGIRNHVYLLFGIPTETGDDREQTLTFVVEMADSIHAVNTALLNLPRRSPMHRHPRRFGITALVPFNDGTDLSLYEDFRCDGSHPRREARRWLRERFDRDPAVRGISEQLRVPMKANHLCFLT